jgi:citrate lyase subunit beta/citryl-CoA lyase
MSRPARSRRTCHAVPGSSERFLAKAPELEADEVFLDLEDAVAPSAKEEARWRVIRALKETDFGPKTVVVRVNATDTPHYYRDLIDVVEQAGDRLDAIMLPKVRTPGDVEMTDKLLLQVELAMALEPGRIGIEAQIEDAAGLIACEAIATASPRMETLIFGPGDYSAAVGIPVTTIGAAPAGYPGDHLNYVYSRLVVAARAAGIQAIDGPYAAVKDEDGLRERAVLARALGMDGKWTIHPAQIAVVNDAFTPRRDEWERAEAMLAAYERASTGEARGAAMFEGEMIDEANRRMAERLASAGRAAGFEPAA